jgi:hypothetical protein
VFLPHVCGRLRSVSPSPIFTDRSPLGESVNYSILININQGSTYRIHIFCDQVLFLRPLRMENCGVPSRAIVKIGCAMVKKRLWNSGLNAGNTGNTCYRSVQSLLSSRPQSRNVKLKIYKTIIRPVVLYGCETWSLTLRNLRVFENGILRRIFGPKRDEVTGEWMNAQREAL